MTKRPRVVCLGSGAYDTILSVDVLPTQDGKYAVRSWIEAGGGMAATAAVTVARLGGRAGWIGCLGRDRWGEALVTGLDAIGVEIPHVHYPEGARTPRSVILIDPNGNRAVLAHGAGLPADDGAWIEPVLPIEADAVMVDVRLPAAARRLLHDAKTRGVPAILDADVMFEDAGDLIDAADNVVFSGPALRQSAGCDDLAEGLHRLRRRTDAFLAVTAGAEGALWLDAKGRIRHIRAPRVDAINTLGAGDVFHGAFALGVAEGLAAEPNLRRAATAAALKCTRPGGWEAVPSRSEVETLMAAVGA